MSFCEGTNFTAKIRKSGIATIRIIQIKVSNSSVSGENRLELESHVDIIVLRK